MDYRTLDADAHVRGILESGARDAAEKALIAGIHEEQFSRLLKHRSASVRQVARQQHADHQKNAERRSRAYQRKAAAAGIPESDLTEQHRATLTQLLTRFEAEHLSNVVAARDVGDAIENDEVGPGDVVQHDLPDGKSVQVTADTQRQVFLNNAAIIEAAIEVCRDRLDALPPAPADPADAVDEALAEAGESGLEAPARAAVKKTAANKAAARKS